MKLHESNAIFVKFHTRSQSTGFAVVLVVVLVLVLDTASNYHLPNFPFLEDEHEDEKNEIKSPAYVLRPQPSIFHLPPSTLYHVACMKFQSPFRSNWPHRGSAVRLAAEQLKLLSFPAFSAFHLLNSDFTPPFPPGTAHTGAWGFRLDHGVYFWSAGLH